MLPFYIRAEGLYKMQSKVYGLITEHTSIVSYIYVQILYIKQQQCPHSSELLHINRHLGGNWQCLRLPLGILCVKQTTCIYS
jgi:hypothetical protein